MSGEYGKPVHLTKGERKLIVLACEEAIQAWQRAELRIIEEGDKDAARVCRMRQRQYRRIILECHWADPDPKSQ